MAIERIDRYQLEDAHTPLIAFVYFSFLVIFGGFFAVNLTLAVLESNFNLESGADPGRMRGAGSAGGDGDNDERCASLVHLPSRMRRSPPCSLRAHSSFTPHSKGSCGSDGVIRRRRDRMAMA